MQDKSSLLATSLHYFRSSIGDRGAKFCIIKDTAFTAVVAKFQKGSGGSFLSYGVLNNALTNPDLVRDWFFTTTLVSRTGPGLASKGLSVRLAIF